jgi:SPP1 gp7 family putative phage head morphogenesis protein
MIEKTRNKFKDFLPTLYSYKKGMKLNDLSDFNFIYEYNFEELNSPIVSIKKSFLSTRILEKKSQNIGRFSGAKTFQEAQYLTSLIYDENGNKTEFKKFKELAFEAFETYNVSYLEAERNNAVSNVEQAKIFNESKQLGSEYLQYIAVGDELTRDDHEALNGLILPINDPLWDSITPPNGYNCRCSIVGVSKFESDFNVSSKNEIENKTKEIKDFFKKNADFARNPAKTDWIFKEEGRGKHSYFNMPAEYKESFKKNNFNLK